VQLAISSEPGAVVNRCRWLGVTSEAYRAIFRVERNNASDDEGLLNPGSKLVARCTRRCPARDVVSDHILKARIKNVHWRCLL